MSRRRRTQPSMNVTPLVDVVLVLLIIFMVVIPAMNKEAKIELPSVENADEDPKSKTDPFTLSINSKGQLFFEEHRLDEKTFRATLEEANRTQPGRRLMVRADRGVKYAEVRRLFQMVQEIGFPGISVRVSQRGGERG